MSEERNSVCTLCKSMGEQYAHSLLWEKYRCWGNSRSLIINESDWSTRSIQASWPCWNKHSVSQEPEDAFVLRLCVHGSRADGPVHVSQQEPGLTTLPITPATIITIVWKSESWSSFQSLCTGLCASNFSSHCGCSTKNKAMPKFKGALSRAVFSKEKSQPL